MSLCLTGSFRAQHGTSGTLKQVVWPCRSELLCVCNGSLRAISLGTRTPICPLIFIIISSLFTLLASLPFCLLCFAQSKLNTDKLLLVLKCGVIRLDTCVSCDHRSQEKEPLVSTSAIFWQVIPVSSGNMSSG